MITNTASTSRPITSIAALPAAPAAALERAHRRVEAEHEHDRQRDRQQRVLREEDEQDPEEDRERLDDGRDRDDDLDPAHRGLRRLRARLAGDRLRAHVAAASAPAGSIHTTIGRSSTRRGRRREGMARLCQAPRPAAIMRARVGAVVRATLRAQPPCPTIGSAAGDRKEPAWPLLLPPGARVTCGRLGDLPRRGQRLGAVRGDHDHDGRRPEHHLGHRRHRQVAASSSQDTQYIFSDLKTWGWIILVLGGLQLAAAFSIWAGGGYGRWFGIASATCQRDRRPDVDPGVSVLVAGDLRDRHPRHLRPGRVRRRPPRRGDLTCPPGRNERSIV